MVKVNFKPLVVSGSCRCQVKMVFLLFSKLIEVVVYFSSILPKGFHIPFQLGILHNQYFVLKKLMSKRGKIPVVLKLYGFPAASFTSSIVVSSSVVE